MYFPFTAFKFRGAPRCLRAVLLTAMALGSLYSQPAHALRIANFVASGQNVITTAEVKGPVKSECVITITNVSATPQAVSWLVKIFAQAPLPAHSGVAGSNYQVGSDLTGSVTLAASGANGTNCSAASDTCTLPTPADSATALDFPTIAATQTTTQNIRCEGWIKVENSTAGNQGFVIASGTLTTFVEATASVDIDGSATTGDNNTVAPTVTPILIGEGRPF